MDAHSRAMVGNNGDAAPTELLTGLMARIVIAARACTISSRMCAGIAAANQKVRLQ